jgi:rod shape determining protein RodA
MNKFTKLDWTMLVSVFLLLFLGMLALYSISLNDPEAGSVNFKKQIVSCIIGITAMFFLASYDYRVLSSYSTKMYFAIIVLLFLVIFFGSTIRGTTGWIGVGIFHIQPVEIAKLVMILFLASFLSKKKNQLSIVVRTISSVVLVSVPVFLILKQPDFGSAAIIVGMWAVMLFVCGLDRKNLLIIFLVFSISAGSGWMLIKDYQKERILNFVDPARDPRGSGYNAIQSMIAVGSGQIWGKGLGHGSQSQLNFLPEKHTDFIFAVISEELGFFGAAIIFILLGFLFYRMKETARMARDNLGYLITIGTMIMIFLQVFVNIGMNVGIMPVAGVPLPFLSYGGSSLVAALAMVGIVQNIYIKRIKNT